MAETLAQKKARLAKLTASQRSAILKNFKLTPTQQSTLRGMSPDRQEAQLKVWQDQFILDNLPAAPKQTTKTPPTETPAAAPAPVPVNWEDAAKELYGAYYAVVQSVPELQDLLKKAVGPPAWSDAKFEYELRQTAWWKTTTDSARQWDLISQMDPATAQQQIDARIVEFRNAALSQFQVDLSTTDLTRLAKDSLRNGWTQQMIVNAIGLQATKTSGGLSDLSSGFIGQGLKQTANEYGVVLSQQTFNKWVSDIASGKETKETFQQYALNTAKTMFPALSQQLDAGLTFQQIVDPYKNVAANILEINPDSINFLDPKWSRAVSMVDGNQQRMMNYNEWGDYLRQERSFGYEYTSEARSRAYEVSNNLANLFGKV